MDREEIKELAYSLYDLLERGFRES